MLLDAFPVGMKSVTLASIWTQSDIAASSCHLVQKAILLFQAKARGVMATLSLAAVILNNPHVLPPGILALNLDFNFPGGQAMN